jgi:hypothetical protein
MPRAYLVALNEDPEREIERTARPMQAPRLSEVGRRGRQKPSVDGIEAELIELLPPPQTHGVILGLGRLEGRFDRHVRHIH